MEEFCCDMIQVSWYLCLALWRILYRYTVFIYMFF